MKEVTINLSQFADGGICVSAADGDKAYGVIKAEIERENRVKLSFAGVTRLTTAFCNSAVGRLYREFPRTLVKKQLAPPIDVEPWQLNCLKRTIDRAGVDQDTARAAMQSETGFDDE